MLTDEEIKKILEIKEKYSIYSLWTNGILFKRVIDSLAEPFVNITINKVLGIEARGFILGSAVAYKLGAGFVVCRKGGKLTKERYPPEKVLIEKVPADYSGKEKILEIEHHEMGIQSGDKVLLVDDWFESGSQGHAAINLIERAGGKVAGISVILDEMADHVRDTFGVFNYHALTRYGKSSKKPFTV